jgi:hypothetical protein
MAKVPAKKQIPLQFSLFSGDGISGPRESRRLILIISLFSPN